MTAGVRREQRFTAANPCPICGGQEGAPRAKGLRCHGFVSAERTYARCSREEHAGGLPREASGTYAHRLAGDCRCGRLHGGENGRTTGSAHRGTQHGGRAPRVVVATYDYRDAASALLYQVERLEPKGFRQRRPNGAGGWIYRLDGVQRVLYRLPELLAADRTAPVFVVEGEKDTDALVALGLIATTNPGGAGKWLPEYSEILRGRHVVIIPDADEPGRRHADQVARSLHGSAGTVRILALPDLPEKGDLSDWAAAGGTREALEALVAATPLWEPADGTAHDDSPVGIFLAEVEPEEVDWLWHGRLARGKLSILEGRPDEGKTTLALDLAARQSTGAPMPGETTRRAPAGVVVVTAEDALADTIRPRLAAAGADLTRCLAARPDESPSLDEDGLAWLRRACARVGAALVILDPLVALMPGKVDAHRDQDVRRMLRPLRTLAEECSVAILAVRHLRKAAASSPTDAGGGSVGIGAAARVVMLAAADPQNADGHVLARVKSNLSAPWPSLSYRLVPTAGTVAIEWGAEVSQTAEDLLAAAYAPGDPEERTRVDEAKEALKTVLALGPVPAKDVEKERHRAGISEWSWRRARTALRVRVAKSGFDVGWMWSLPEGDGPRRPSPSTPSAPAPPEKPAPIIEDDGHPEDGGPQKRVETTIFGGEREHFRL